MRKILGALAGATVAVAATVWIASAKVGVSIDVNQPGMTGAGICSKGNGVGVSQSGKKDGRLGGCNTVGILQPAEASGPTCCIDGIQDCTESDADCGGGCGPTCHAGQGCNAHTDCCTHACNFLIPSQCMLGFLHSTCCDGTDCDQSMGSYVCQGSPLQCLADIGTSCTSSIDCASGAYCNPVSHTCIVWPGGPDGGYPPGCCPDGIQDCTESGVDCGGGCGPTCGLGQTCNVDGDCLAQGENYSQIYCQPGGGIFGGLGAYCNYIGWYQCVTLYCNELGNVCSNGADGDQCLNPWDCQSFVCSDLTHTCVNGQAGNACNDDSECEGQVCVDNVCSCLDVCCGCRDDSNCYNCGGNCICDSGLCHFPIGSSCDPDPTCPECQGGICNQFNDTCSDGSPGSPCAVPADCVSGNCSVNVCT